MESSAKSFAVIRNESGSYDPVCFTQEAALLQEQLERGCYMAMAIVSSLHASFDVLTRQMQPFHSKPGPRVTPVRRISPGQTITLNGLVRNLLQHQHAFSLPSNCS